MRGQEDGQRLSIILALDALEQVAVDRALEVRMEMRFRFFDA
jgi:hypothetical protein